MNWFHRFSRGLTAILQGGALLQAHPRWWRYALAPVSIQILLSVTFLMLVNAYAFAWIQGQLEPLGLGWWQSLLRWSLHVLTFVVSALMSGVLWVALAGVLCPFFYGRLTLAAELQLGTPSSELGELSLREEVSEALWVLLQLACVQASLFLVAWFPLIGATLALVLGWYANAWKLGSEVFDYPLAVRGMNRKQKQAVRARYRPEVLGLGTSVIVIAAIPILGSVLLVPCILGAVTLFGRIRQEDNFRE